MNGFVSQLIPTMSGFMRMAIIAGVESAVRIHIDRGDNLNARDARGHTPLMLAAARNKPNICKLLLDAGADPLLKNPDGNDALFIANAAGAYEVVSILELAPSKRLQTVSADDSFPLPVDDAPDNDDLICIAEPNQEATSPQSDIPEANDIESQLPKIADSDTTLHAPAPDSDHDHDDDIGLPTIAILRASGWTDFDEDSTPLDLSGWEAEAESSMPDGDPTVLIYASEVQNAIREHAPIDVSADWDDFEAFLPDRAAPILKADDAEARERLRSLLLRATREGSVPNAAIEDLTLNDDQTPNIDAEALLRMVINDLGSEADDRHEYSTPYENFAVYVHPRETSDEGQTVDDALAYIDALESRHNDPLRLYQREFQQTALLTADEEVALGKAMEQGIESALDALAASKTGIEAIVEASQLVKSGVKPLRWMSSGKRNDAKESESNLDDSLEPISDSSNDDAECDKGTQETDSDEVSPAYELSEFISNSDLLSTIARSPATKPVAFKTKRDLLGLLGLSGTYLIGLTESGRIAESQSARDFNTAMKEYRNARERMTIANLKLVHSIAKKYLYSGIPLDDLLQEGNIGLLKGVERFDWRRGFKFSTFATWWIRQQVGRYVADKGRIIRIPVHVYEKVQRISQVSRAFEIDNGRTPTPAEIAELAHLSLRKVTAYMHIAGEPLPIHEIDVDSMIAIDTRDEYISRDPMDIAIDRDLSVVIQKVLGTFKLKDENIIRMRFGIGVPEPMTLDEIGIRLGLTRERIRQIESKAIRHMKHPGRVDALLTALNGPNPPERPKEDDECESRSYDAVDEAQVQELHEAVAVRSPRKNGAISPSGKMSVSCLQANATESTACIFANNDHLQKLLDEAEGFGVTISFDQYSTKDSIWVDVSKAHTTPSQTWIRKMMDSGFKLWPGKGYWR